MTIHYLSLFWTGAISSLLLMFTRTIAESTALLSIWDTPFSFIFALDFINEDPGKEYQENQPFLYYTVLPSLHLLPLLILIG